MKEKKLPDSVFHKMTSSDELKDMFRSIESVLFVPKDVEQMSFADDLLKFVHSEKVVLDLVTLSNTPNLRRIKNVSENEEPGTICVFDVDVVLKKDHLEVQKWNPLQWIDESHIKSERVLNVILVHSKSLRVVETKLRVYKEFESLFGSKSTMPHLQHENEEYDEIAKKSAKAKVSSFRRTIYSLIQSISSLDILSIVSEAIDQAFSVRNVRDICLSEFISDGENVGTVYSNSYTCRFFVTVRRIKNTLVKNSLRTINKSLGSQISGRILQHIESKLQTVFKHDQFRQNMNITDKIFATITVGMEYFADPISNQLQSVIFAIGSLIETFINTVDVNSSTWRRKVAEEIVLALSKNKEDILQKICLSVENIKQTTTEDLHNVSEKLEEWEKNIKCVDIDEVVPIWKKREAFKNINGLGNHKSVLNLIAGIKNDKPTLKVFLRIDDQNAKRFIKDHPEIPKETNVEFVVVISNKEQRNQAKTKNYPIEKNMREKLSKIIKSQGERIHANHSGVVGLGIGNMDCNGPIMPCIIIYCLDKDLVPFGEKPLPKTLEGFRCDIREDFIMFGACFDCHEIAHPNPGCCIGLPSNGIGSAGFLAKTNELGLETSGFLTAAHVAAENWTDLYNDNAFLSELEVGQYNREIVHPLLPNDNSGRIIGKVKESFCGNWGPDGIGIDAAFVQNYEQDKAAYRELKPADESELDYDNQLIVLKRGGTTGQTFGRLIDKCYSPSVNPPVDNIAWGLGRFYFFDRCFAVEDINGPFFNLGDSGSGVFLTENGHPTKPLGIAFAKLEYGQITVVCRIDQVTKAFNLRLYEIAEPMDTSLQMQ